MTVPVAPAETSFENIAKDGLSPSLSAMTGTKPVGAVNAMLSAARQNIARTIPAPVIVISGATGDDACALTVPMVS